jgi:DNA polymerase
MDFETYSEAGYCFEKQPPSVGGRWVPPYKVKGVGRQGKGGLPVVGTPVYAEHPTTEILSLYYDLKDGRGRRCWLPGFPSPFELFDYINAGGLVEGHNVTFEWYIWNLVAVRKLGWPVIPLHQCRCTMAKSKRFSLPGALGGAAGVLGTPGKDKAGTNLIRRLCVPHTPTKNRSEHRWAPATAWPDFEALYKYNEQDVVAEDHLSAHVPDLPPAELDVWLVDQTINARGVQVDTETLEGALRILDSASTKYNAELCQITQGAVESVTQNKRFIDWVNSRGVATTSLDEDHRDALLSQPLPPDVQRALEIAQQIMSANVRKLRALKLQTSSDGRLRDQYRYCGADRTGRWSANGVQLQNMTAKGPKSNRCESCGKLYGSGVPSMRRATPTCPRCGSWMWHALPEWTINAVEQAAEDIQSGSLQHIEQVWGSPVPVLCGCLRGLLVAKPGHELICCDYSAIEAVAAACLARCQWRIDVFNTHGLIYEVSASNATGIPLDEILDYKKQHGTHHPARKGVGKVRELANGYGGWVNASKAFGADEYYADDEAIKQDILKWRDESPEIVEMWGGQYRWCGPGKWDYLPELHGLEGAAIQAILSPGKCFGHNDISYGVADDILYCRLPSGRYLYYHRPRLHEVPDKLNRGPSLQITFEGYNSNPQKGRVGWVRMETFGGRLFENVVQAVSRDIQAEAMVRLERAGYPIVMHTHDEICAEIPAYDHRTPEDMAAIMIVRPEWAAWWPIRAAGWRHRRYQKD